MRQFARKIPEIYEVDTTISRQHRTVYRIDSTKEIFA